MNGIPIVVPVRFASRNSIVQATSGWLSVEAVFVRCPVAPPKDAVIALRISLPGEYLLEHVEGVVGKRIPPEAQGEPGFWVGFQELPAASRRRIARFVEGRNAAPRTHPPLCQRLAVAHQSACLVTVTLLAGSTRRSRVATG